MQLAVRGPRVVYAGGMVDEELPQDSGEKTGLGTVIGAAVLAIALVAFIFQNTDDTPVEWLFVSESAPLWLIIVISAVAGAPDPEAAARFLLTQPFIEKVDLDGVCVLFDFTGNDEELSDLLGRAIGAGVRIVEFRQLEADLEDIFLHTTKGRLQ